MTCGVNVFIVRLEHAILHPECINTKKAVSGCDVNLSLVRHNWGKRPFKTLPANPQHTKRLRSTISLINLEYIHDYYTIFNGNEKKTTINF